MNIMDNDPVRGVLSDSQIGLMISYGRISVPDDMPTDQVQPASLDLSLGKVAHRLRSSFLPGARTVEQRLQALRLHTLDLTQGAVLEVGAVYLVPLREALFLSTDLSGTANPKSSTGRLDVFTRVITDFGTSFDKIPAGYHGPLYLEICPKSFPIIVRDGSRLAQLRLRTGEPTATDDEARLLHSVKPLIRGGEADICNGLALSVSLEGCGDDIIGYRARRHSGVIDMDKKLTYVQDDYWEPVRAPKRGFGLILDPNEFYILASREFLRVPPSHAAEMVAYDTSVGEFRAHYAGFFDPGFGDWETVGSGARAVLEVRSHDVPFMIEHGQTVCRLVYERMAQVPDALYGASPLSNYQGQGLKLSKHFA